MIRVGGMSMYHRVPATEYDCIGCSHHENPAVFQQIFAIQKCVLPEQLPYSALLPFVSATSH